MPRVQRALLSVTDKTGIATFAKALQDLGIELISTGGTAALLRKEGVAVRDVAEITGFPEMLDGRVKTIHPNIAGGVLAIRSNPQHMEALQQQGIGLIDMVVVNLYEFEKIAARKDAPLEELIENIDIGGPTMIRAAAKNYQAVAVVVSPSDYEPILAELRASDRQLSRDTCWKLSLKAWARTAAYDRAVSARLSGSRIDLRYGENPHQQATLYSSGSGGIAGAKQLHGKELSYNNFVDLDAAWQLIQEFERPAGAIIKHTNPCGCAEQDSLAEAYRKAFEADPISAFGGVLAFNQAVDEDTASEIAKTFIEAIAAPCYTKEALTILQGKKNLRLLEVSSTPQEMVMKSISGGYLTQTPDSVKLNRSQAKVVTNRQPTENEWIALEFAWKVVKHVKSNAILYAYAGQIVSAGAGQMSRVDSVKVGAMKAILPLKDTVLASDAFFPFPDGLEEAAKHGITAVIQPGGSVRDADVIAAADNLGLAMVFTGFRHFRH